MRWFHKLHFTAAKITSYHPEETDFEIFDISSIATDTGLGLRDTVLLETRQHDGTLETRETVLINLTPESEEFGDGVNQEYSTQSRRLSEDVNCISPNPGVDYSLCSETDGSRFVSVLSPVFADKDVLLTEKPEPTMETSSELFFRK